MEKYIENYLLGMFCQLGKKLFRTKNIKIHPRAATK
jgi:hypothetical protein